MSLWNKLQKHGAEQKKVVAAKLDDAVAKATEHKIVLGDAVAGLPDGYKKGLLAGAGLFLLAIGGAAFAAGRLGKVEDETLGGLSKMAGLVGDVLSKIVKK